MVPRENQPTRKLNEEAPTEKLGAESPWRFAPGKQLADGRYVLRRRLGYGGMSTVWLADDRRLDRSVAVKVLSDTLASDPDYVQRFDREARVAAGLSHQNLVSIFDFDAGDRPYLVMEYVAGGDLAERIEAGSAPDPARLAHDLLSALDTIHAAGVIHRDVKPKNVLIGAEDRTLLTDFGIARPSDATALTRTGLVLGTGDFIAPEVLAGGRSDERSDLYSLGVTLEQVIEARGADRELRAVARRLRSHEPADRPASAAAALRALAWRDAPLTAAPATEPRAVTATRWSRLPVALVPLIVALVAVALIIGSLGDDGGGDGAGAGQEQAGRESGGGDRGGAEKQKEPKEKAPAPPTGSELNDQGYALIQQGRAGEAVPILQSAVEALDGSGEITYAYALYNLGWALRLAGRPEEAIPILEARLEIPNQHGAVKQQLELARDDAGLSDEKGKDKEDGTVEDPPDSDD